MAKSVHEVKANFPNWLKGMDKPNAKWGSQNESDWEAVQDFALKIGLIKKDIPVSDYFTNQFNDKINDFDVEAVREQARNFNLDMVKYDQVE